MPKLYEYLGLVVFFYSNEHEPMHVHARYQGYESRIDIIIEKGDVKELLVREVKGKKPLPKSQLKDFEHLVGKLSDEIVQSWINYFVYNMSLVPKKIDGRL
jgi:hypothetical protein